MGLDENVDGDRVLVAASQVDALVDEAGEVLQAIQNGFKLQDGWFPPVGNRFFVNCRLLQPAGDQPLAMALGRPERSASPLSLL